MNSKLIFPIAFFFSTVLLLLSILTFHPPVKNNPTPASIYPTQIPTKRYRITYKNKDIIDIGNTNFHNFSIWKNFLFTGSSEYSDDPAIISQNLDTGETQVVFNLSGRKDFPKLSNRNSVYISDMFIHGNTLFFSIGGYLSPGATFYLDLPVIKSAKKIADGSNGSVRYEHDRFWIVSGEGDACWGTQQYSLLDIITKKVTPITEFNMDCDGNVQEFIGVDQKNRLIKLYSVISPDGDPSIPSVSKKVELVSLKNPNQKLNIISEKSMPPKTDTVWYLPECNQIILKSAELNKIYFFDLNNDSFIETSNCSGAETYPTPSLQKTTEDEFVDLNLPPEFQLIIN